MMYTYTHRGTASRIKDCIEKQCIPISNCNPSKFLCVVDHDKRCIWVSKGYPNLITYVFSGMIQYHFAKQSRKSYIVFETNEKAKTPNGLIKRWFIYSQKVFEHDLHFREIKILDYKIFEK